MRFHSLDKTEIELKQNKREGCQKRCQHECASIAMVTTAWKFANVQRLLQMQFMTLDY